MIQQLWELLEFALAPLNANIIWSYQNSARVAKPYVLVNYNTVDVPDHEHYSLPDVNGIRVNSSWRKAVVDLQFYCARDSYAFASKAASLLATNAVIDKMWFLDVAVGNRLFLQRVPALLNESQFEDRAIYQFDFYYTELTQDDVGNIETVVIDGTYPSDDGTDGIGDDNMSGENITDLICHEVITIDVFTDWDNKTTTWDNRTTVWI